MTFNRKKYGFVLVISSVLFGVGMYFIGNKTGHESGYEEGLSAGEKIYKPLPDVRYETPPEGYNQDVCISYVKKMEQGGMEYGSYRKMVSVKAVDAFSKTFDEVTCAVIYVEKGFKSNRMAYVKDPITLYFVLGDLLAHFSPEDPRSFSFQAINRDEYLSRKKGVKPS